MPKVWVKDPADSTWKQAKKVYVNIGGGTGGWTLSAIETVFAASATDNAIAITPGGSYGHSPSIGLNVDDTDTVDLSIGATGLIADVRIDPASPIPINVGPDGISVDAIPPTVDAVPTGSIFDFAGLSAPSGYLLCEGQEILRSTYPNLDAVISTTWGSYTDGSGNPGSTHMRLPDFRGRISVGAGTGAGGDSQGNGLPTGSALSARTIGDWGGRETHQLSLAELPSHNHGGTTGNAGSHNHAPGSAGREFVTVTTSGLTTTNVNQTLPAGSPAYPVTRYVAGSSGGATTQAVTINEPAIIKIGTSRQQLNNSATDTVSDHAHSISSAGSDTSHNNIQPYIVTNKIIKT